MNALKLTAIVLIVAGVLGLGYGGFSYTKQTHEVKMGPIEMSVKERRQSTSRFGQAWEQSRSVPHSCCWVAGRPRGVDRVSSISRSVGVT